MIGEGVADRALGNDFFTVFLCQHSFTPSLTFTVTCICDGHDRTVLEEDLIGKNHSGGTTKSFFTIQGFSDGSVFGRIHIYRFHKVTRKTFAELVNSGNEQNCVFDFLDTSGFLGTFLGNSCMGFILKDTASTDIMRICLAYLNEL